MDKFVFEHTHKFTENEYVELMRVKKSNKRILKLTFLALIGIACLFCPYTFILGVILIIFTFSMPLLIRTIPGTTANNYKKMYILRAENSYGVNEKELWMKNEKSFSKISWKLASMWEERAGWLRVISESSQNFWFPTLEMKQAGIYQNVIELCKAHAKRRFPRDKNIVRTQKA